MHAATSFFRYDVPLATVLASNDFLGLPAWKWFDLQRRSGAPTYHYHYTHVRPRFSNDLSSKAAWGGVHSADIEYALGHLDANPLYAWTDADQEVSATMSAYRANFVKFGDLNGAGAPIWPKVSLDKARIWRQIIGAENWSVDFQEQRRYAASDQICSCTSRTKNTLLANISDLGGI